MDAFASAIAAEAGARSLRKAEALGQTPGIGLGNTGSFHGRFLGDPARKGKAFAEAAGLRGSAHAEAVARASPPIPGGRGSARAEAVAFVMVLMASALALLDTRQL